MTRLLVLLLTLAMTLNGSTQNLVRDYKRTADEVLVKYFDKAILPRIKCDIFSESDQEGTERSFYKENSNKALSLSTITFDYYLFDSTLNDDIRFYVTLDKNHRVSWDSSIIKRVPACVRDNQPCYFISADSAKKIAIVDAIPFPTNINYQLERNKQDGEFYWVVTGRKANKTKTNASPLTRSASSISATQERFIHAQTGAIISSKQFSFDW
jgi:hypothetical protein